MVCQRAVTLIVDLCLHNSTLLDRDTCQDYLFLLSSQGSNQKESGKIDSRKHAADYSLLGYSP